MRRVSNTCSGEAGSGKLGAHLGKPGLKPTPNFLDRFGSVPVSLVAIGPRRGCPTPQRNGCKARLIIIVSFRKFG